MCMSWGSWNMCTADVCSLTFSDLKYLKGIDRPCELTMYLSNSAATCKLAPHARALGCELHTCLGDFLVLITLWSSNQLESDQNTTEGPVSKTACLLSKISKLELLGSWTTAFCSGPSKLAHASCLAVCCCTGNLAKPLQGPCRVRTCTLSDRLFTLAYWLTRLYCVLLHSAFVRVMLMTLTNGLTPVKVPRSHHASGLSDTNRVNKHRLHRPTS